MQHLKKQFIDQIQKTACSLLKVLNSEKKNYISFHSIVFHSVYIGITQI